MNRAQTDVLDCGQRGYTLIEVLIATVLMVVMLIPGMQALNDVVRAGTESRIHATLERLLQNRMTTVLAVPYGVLAAAAGNERVASSFSDPTTADPRILVYISHYDGDATGLTADPFQLGSLDAQLLWIRVAVERTDQNLTTLVHQ